MEEVSYKKDRTLIAASKKKKRREGCPKSILDKGAISFEGTVEKEKQASKKGKILMEDASNIKSSSEEVTEEGSQRRWGRSSQGSEGNKVPVEKKGRIRFKKL